MLKKTLYTALVAVPFAFTAQSVHAQAPGESRPNSPNSMAQPMNPASMAAAADQVIVINTGSAAADQFLKKHEETWQLMVAAMKKKLTNPSDASADADLNQARTNLDQQRNELETKLKPTLTADQAQKTATTMNAMRGKYMAEVQRTISGAAQQRQMQPQGAQPHNNVHPSQHGAPVTPGSQPNQQQQQGSPQH